MTTVEVRQQTFSISGFGGGYEDMCQRMLWRGVAYLAERKPPLEMWKGAQSSPNVFGLVLTEGDDLKALEKAIIHDGDDVTGAMHHAVMQHLFYIHKNGLDAWREELAPHRTDPGDAFEWVGTL